MRRKPTFAPVVVYDKMGYTRQYAIAAEGDGERVCLIMNDTTRAHLYTREILSGQIDARYAISDTDPKVMASGFKKHALIYGATPEAIRLLGLLCPFSKDEESIMSEKKLAPKKGDAEALKGAAAKAPVGGGKASKPKQSDGQKAGLAKAQEQTRARSAAAQAKKITALKKPKDIQAREGSFRHTMLTDLLASKTVGEFLAKTPADSKSKYDSGCLRFAEKEGYVKIG